MREGLVPGHAAEAEWTVTADMLATFDRGPVHPVLSTFSMIRCMEWAGRQVILPFLEPHEEAVGYHVDVRHLAPTAAGDRIRVRAELLEIQGNRIICRVEARNPRRMIGEGRFVQVLLDKETLRASIEEAHRAVRGQAV